MKREDIKVGMKVHIMPNAATSCEVGTSNYWVRGEMESCIGEVCEVSSIKCFYEENLVEVRTANIYHKWIHVGALESAEEEVMYHVGQVFQFKDGEHFIIAHVDSDQMTLISLTDGNRWSKCVSHGSKHVPERVLKQMIGATYVDDFKLVYNSGVDMVAGKKCDMPVHEGYHVKYSTQATEVTRAKYKSIKDFTQTFPDAKFLEFIKD